MLRELLISHTRLTERVQYLERELARQVEANDRLRDALAAKEAFCQSLEGERDAGAACRQLHTGVQ